MNEEILKAQVTKVEAEDSVTGYSGDSFPPLRVSVTAEFTGGEVTFTINNLDLVEGTYKLDVAVHNRDHRPYDYHRLLYTFRVKSRTSEVGIYRPKHQWQFSPNIKYKR